MNVAKVVVGGGTRRGLAGRVNGGGQRGRVMVCNIIENGLYILNVYCRSTSIILRLNTRMRRKRWKKKKCMRMKREE